jgi:hypothetical protein
MSVKLSKKLKEINVFKQAHQPMWLNSENLVDHSETSVRRTGSAGEVQYKLHNEVACRSVGDKYVCKNRLFATGLEALKIMDPAPTLCNHCFIPIRPYGGNSGRIEYCEKCVNHFRFEAAAAADVAKARVWSR